ncbi:MAG: hypothetical protein J5772_07815 [Clostridia bacterium]|nr:hypothetical protein [Clostridia bacterium]
MIAIETSSSTGAAARAKPGGDPKLRRRLKRLSEASLICLEEILTDSACKAADRISAVKLTFELMKQLAAEPTDDGALRVIIEGCPREHAE